MIGILVVAHGNLATEFVATLEHIVGPQENVRAIAIFPDDDMKAKREEIMATVEEINSGAGVVILTDLFGGTPSNLALTMLEKDKTEVVAGVNLPLLVRLAKLRNSNSLDDCVNQACQGGRQYIVIASQTLRGKPDTDHDA